MCTTEIIMYIYIILISASHYAFQYMKWFLYARTLTTYMRHERDEYAFYSIDLHTSIDSNNNMKQK